MKQRRRRVYEVLSEDKSCPPEYWEIWDNPEDPINNRTGGKLIFLLCFSPTDDRASMLRTVERYRENFLPRAIARAK